MKKIILVLSVLITATAGAFAYTDLQPKPELNSKSRLGFPAQQHEADNALVASLYEDISIDTKENILSDKVSQINLIQDDEQKIKEWAKLNSTENYVIINKKDCSATVYDKDGIELKTFEIGIGRDIGDDFNDTYGLAGKPRNTTPAGEYTLHKNIFNTSAYGDFTLSLGAKANKTKSTKKVVALHKIPKFRLKARGDKFYDGDLKNNRMSHGCINFVEKDFNELIQYVHSGLKTYILPEEANNHLMLEKNDKNEFEFIQTKHLKKPLKSIIDSSKSVK